MANKLTPMMQQYLSLKEQYKDALLFFRLGDFYEMFFEDAKTASRELEITLTGRDCGLDERAPMCGVPHHSADNYIKKLITKGYKVAICEQLEDPSESKGIVKRDIVRIITPGTIIESSILSDKDNNYIAAFYNEDNKVGLAAADLSTGEFIIAEFDDNKTYNNLINEITRLNPGEIIYDKSIADNKLLTTIASKTNTYLSEYHSWAFNYTTAEERIKGHLKTASIDGFGLKGYYNGIRCAGALLEYMYETQKNTLNHINTIKPYYIDSYMILDYTTQRNLELIETIRTKTRKGSLLWLLDKTLTAMGGRKLKKFLLQPLIDENEIKIRLSGVEELYNNPDLCVELKSRLKEVYDLERLCSRISYSSVNGRDLNSLKHSLKILPGLKNLLCNCSSVLLKDCYCNIDTLDDVFSLIDNSIMDDCPITIKDGNIIKSSYNKLLKEYRLSMSDGKRWIADYEQQERLKTGIKNLKVKFNKVFGYYIDVTKSYYHLVPENYTRKQTLANSERYITPELKEIEDKILNAEDKSIKLEYDLFIQIRDELLKYIDRIQNTASIIATIDVLLSLAKTAYDNGYVKPSINTDGIINIKNGRHPVVEKNIPNELFVPNDIYLDKSNNNFIIITGPNMAGKSTYMRQCALIVLMAQIGSFVPADEATISIVDRVFTRVGASDDLSSGQSTFMVEMSEVSNILNNATEDSLLVLDEIGRGTSTYDGLSIAWAVVEYISSKSIIGARTLFATHYHELTELEDIIEGVKNYCIAVKENGDDIVFLRKIKRGNANRSFGIEVAKLAGLPDAVIERAKELLSELEASDLNKSDKPNSINNKKVAQEPVQLDFLSNKSSEIENELRELDILNLTPIEALNTLYNLVKKAKSKL